MSEPEARSQEPVRLVYVMGHGRSGSTVLDTLLGNHPQVEGLGEIINLVRDGWLKGLYCACGEPAPACPFWTRVRAAWGRRLGLPGPPPDDQLEGYVRLQRRFERYRSLPWLAVAGALTSPEFQEYGRLTLSLLEAVREVAGKPVLVDSSKIPARAMALSWIPGIDLRLLHLVRDGRGVAYSLSKAYSRDVRAGLQKEFEGHPVTRTASRWVVSNLAADLVRRRVEDDDARVLRYEDLMTEPGEVLGLVGETMGVDLAPLIERLERGESFATGHTIAGNRVRMSGAIRPRLDEAWREELPEEDRLAFERRTAWALRRYGYEV